MVHLDIDGMPSVVSMCEAFCAMCLQQQYDFLVISAVYIVDGMVVLLCVSTQLFYSVGINPISRCEP